MKERDSKLTLQSSSLLSVKKIAETKKTALRRGVWFRTLDRVERGIIDLTVRYVKGIKSTKLAMVVTAIIEKLQAKMERITDKLTRTIGLSLARKISEIAVGWGNHSASIWAEDLAFARYLAFSVAKT